MCHSIEIFEIETKRVFDNNVYVMYKNFNNVYKKSFSTIILTNLFITEQCIEQLCTLTN